MGSEVVVGSQRVQPLQGSAHSLCIILLSMLSPLHPHHTRSQMTQVRIRNSKFGPALVLESTASSGKFVLGFKVDPQV